MAGIEEILVNGASTTLAIMLLLIVFSGCDSGSSGRVQPELESPVIVIWGDSIRMSYEPHLRDLAFLEWDIWSPGVINGGDSARLVEHLRDIKGIALSGARPADLYHINAGIWDATFGTSPQAYEENMREAIESLMGSEDIVILATSTYVANPAIDARIRSQNATLRRLASEYDIYLNDLGMLSRQQALEQFDGVHFDETAASILANEVFRVVHHALEEAQGDNAEISNRIRQHVKGRQ